jgi:hypothetical protein
MSFNTQVLERPRRKQLISSTRSGWWMPSSPTIKRSASTDVRVAQVIKPALQLIDVHGEQVFRTVYPIPAPQQSCARCPTRAV